MRKVTVAAMVAVLAAATAAQQPPTPPFFALMLKGEYLHALEVIERGWETGPDKERYTQFRPELDGFVVQTQELRAPLPAVDAGMLARFDGARARDAVAEIAERAKRTRLVIVNEAHDNPRDRAFVLAVAEALRPLGYTHYAAETFSQGNPYVVARLTRERFPRHGDGFFTADPMFGYLVRRVLALGYRPVIYESAFSPADASLSPQQQIARREQAQAENLARALAAAGPDAKFLVHVGYGHAYEQPLGTQDMMARWLARLTGIDPLTVDQVMLSEFGPNAGRRALYHGLIARVGNRPKVFVKGGAPVNAEPSLTDLQVVHPPVRSLGGRPDWLQRTGRRALTVPATLMPASGRRLIQVFGKDDPANAVPIDQVLVTARQARPLVYIPRSGAIRWAVQDG